MKFKFYSFSLWVLFKLSMRMMKMMIFWNLFFGEIPDFFLDTFIAVELQCKELKPPEQCNLRHTLELDMTNIPYCNFVMILGCLKHLSG